MIGPLASRVSQFVTDHDLLVIALVLLLTGAVGAGLPQLDMEDQTAIDDEVFTSTDVGEALEYMNTHYEANDSDEIAVSSVYVRPDDGNALSRSSLLDALAYQQTVLEAQSVQRELVEGDAVTGPATRVGTHLAGEDATLAEQRAAIEASSDEALAGAIRATLQDRNVAAAYLPRTYEPGSTEAESMRMRFEFEKASVTQQQEPLPADAAQQVLFETAEENPAVFTMGPFAQEDWDSAQITDVLWLIIPPALLLVIAVLAFAYRDIVDVLLGFLGVAISVLWFFGILGWLGIPAGFASIVGPVLIVALSIDFGIHVFMRYREQRGPTEEIRPAMARSSSSVMVAFLLVALTAGVGFLANATSPIGFIRSFGVVITLGVLGSVFIFVTLIPALKIRVDSILERVGFDRQKTALGTTGRLAPALNVGVRVAQRGGLAVILVALLLGSLGAFAYTEIDRQGFQQDFADEGDWQTELPEPIGWSAHETDYRQNLDYVQNKFQSDLDRDRTTTLLIQGNVTDVEALERLLAGATAAQQSDVTYRHDGTVPVSSPLTVLTDVAAENPEFAALLTEVGADNQAFGELLDTLAEDDQQFAAALQDAGASTSRFETAEADLTAVYDSLYQSASEDGSRVLERQDGKYRSMRLVVPMQQGLDVNERGKAMHTIADETESDSNLSVVPVGFATVSNAGLGEIADSILQTMLLAFAGVAIVLAAMYRLERNSASLGAVTVVPIAIVIGLVFGGMYLFDIPLTFITAFLASITIGLGIDYNIHISDRFGQELDRGKDPVDALSETVTGTGGALFGSALTSSAAFATLLLHPSPVFQSFGFIVVVALLLSFAVSVLVFPSMLLWWSRKQSGQV